MSSYDSLRRQSRTLESLLDGKLTAYSRLASSISLGHDLEAGGSASRREDIQNEVEGLLDKVCRIHSMTSIRQSRLFALIQLRETHEEMAAMLNDPLAPPSQSILHAVQRHRDALQDYTRDFHRAKVNYIVKLARLFRV